jgi:deoxyribodipyrimidine photolyase
MVVHGDPVKTVPRIAKEIGASSVHISADCAPYGRQRDQAVEEALGDIELVPSGSPYAVTPGRVCKQDGTPFKVFTPFRNAWLEHGWRTPADTDASTLDWIRPDAARQRRGTVRGLEAGAHGVSVVDAGMRQLLQEGFMHNKARRPRSSTRTARTSAGTRRTAATSRRSSTTRWSGRSPWTGIRPSSERQVGHLGAEHVRVGVDAVPRA